MIPYEPVLSTGRVVGFQDELGACPFPFTDLQ